MGVLNTMKMANVYDHVNGDQSDIGSSSEIHCVNLRSDAASPSLHSRNRSSSDLIPLTAEYVRMKTDLRTLISVLTTYQKCTQDLEESRFRVAEQLALLSEGTPIQNEVGRELDGEANEKLHLLSQRFSSSSSLSLKTSFSPSISTPKPSSSMSLFFQSMGLLKEVDSRIALVTQISEDYQKRNETNNLSLRGIYNLGAAQAVGNDEAYQLHVVDYTTKWIEIITERIDSGLKRVRKLASERLHYERKIETLRNRANDLERKGKTRQASEIERLSRNEIKLKKSYLAHEEEAGKLCAHIETMTQEGYRDLFILIRNYMQWEMDRIGVESEISFQLKLTLDSLNRKCEKIAETKEQKKNCDEG